MITIVIILGFFAYLAIAVGLSIWLSFKLEKVISLTPKKIAQRLAKKEHTDIGSELISQACDELGDYNFSDGTSFAEKVERFPHSYEHARELLNLAPSLLGDAAKKYSQRKKVGSAVSFIVMMSMIIFANYLPSMLFNKIEPQLRIAEIKEAIRSEEDPENIKLIEVKLLDLRNLTEKLSKSDSISEIKNVSGDLLLLGSEVTSLIETQREENQFAAAVIEEEIKKLEFKIGQLEQFNKMESLQREAVRDFYLKELVRSGWTTFWLGIIVSVFAQLVLMLIGAKLKTKSSQFVE